MSIRKAELNRLYGRSGNRCAFSSCRRLLIVHGAQGEPPVTLGEVAHIIASSPAGPRGDAFMSPEERDRYENLILLCNIHHQLIDSAPATYTPERLRGMKEEHERWVEERLAGGVTDESPAKELVDDRVFSTLLPVTQMPTYVYAAPCRFKTEQEVKARLRSLRRNEMAPFVIREDKVFAFQNLHAKSNPFAPVIKSPVKRIHLGEVIEDPDRLLWVVTLLNRSLNKLTGRLGLHLDREHSRYFFPMTKPGEPRTETYRPLSASQSTLSVVWQPKRKSTGEHRNYWLHRAVSLRFLKIGDDQWVLALRPELRVTTDGSTPLHARGIGPRVTRKKARLFNVDLLKEVQFWRDYLSRQTPRIVLPFGAKGQRITIASDLMEGSVRWPGIPEEHAVRFRNVNFEDDLFSSAEAELEDDDLDDHDLNEVEDDEIG